MTFKPHGRTLAAILAVFVAGFGLVDLVNGPGNLQAQLPALVLLLIGGSVFAASRLRGAARAKIVVVLLSVLVGLYAWELFLTLSLPRRMDPNYDRRTKREVVLDLRLQGDTAAVPIAYPSFLIYYPRTIPKPVRQIMATGLLPLGGLSDRTTVLCNESGKYAIYRADEHGFRNPAGAWRVAPRVAVVGDSFSHGQCVDDGEDWVGVIRRSVPQTLNLGMGGDGPLFMLAKIREYLRALKSPILIWQYLEGHDTRIRGELRVPILKRYLEETSYSQGLAGRQAEIDAMVEKVTEWALAESEAAESGVLFELKNVLLLTSVANAISPPALPAAGPHELALLARILREAKNMVESWGGKMYFVYLPAYRGLQPGPPPSHYASHDQVLALVKDLELDVVDLDPVFRNHPDPLSLFPYRRNNHYNAAGYALVADTLLKRIPVSR
jgi:hypothetical protein